MTPLPAGTGSVNPHTPGTRFRTPAAHMDCPHHATSAMPRFAALTFRILVFRISLLIPGLLTGSLPLVATCLPQPPSSRSRVTLAGIVDCTRPTQANRWYSQPPNVRLVSCIQPLSAAAAATYLHSPQPGSVLPTRADRWYTQPAICLPTPPSLLPAS